MGRLGQCRVTGLADIAHLARPVRGLSVRIGAGCAPEFAAAGAYALTERQLLGLLHGFYLLVLFGKQVGNRRAFQLFTRMKILPVFAGIQQAGLTLQVALLAYA